MNRRILIVIVCALVLSASASFLVYRAVGSRATSAKPRQTAQLIVATRDLVVGTLIHETDLKLAPWFGPVPPDAVSKRESLLNRGVVAEIYQGEPVTEKRLAAQGSGGGLAATIPPGMRACGVKVNEVVGVAGFVVPGMRVDVLITGLPPGGNTLDGPKVRTLLQNIQVLSAGTNFQKDHEGKPEQAQVVNLLVTPGDAEILSLASNETRIQLVLRNPIDTELSKPPGTIMSDLFGHVRAPEPVPSGALTVVRPPVKHSVPEAAAPEPYVVDVSNGPVHTQAKFTRPVGN